MKDFKMTTTQKFAVTLKLAIVQVKCNVWTKTLATNVLAILG